MQQYRCPEGHVNYCNCVAAYLYYTQQIKFCGHVIYTIHGVMECQAKINHTNKGGNL